MSKKQIFINVLLITLAALLCIVLLGGCSNVNAEKTTNVSRFACVENIYDWEVVYDRYTRVMYAVSKGSYNRGSFTLLVDSEGKPLLWSGT